MAQYYTKINTLYKRYGVEESERSHPLKGCIKIGEYSDPETELLKDLKWKCTEKIDGTNMSVCLTPEFDPSIDVDWKAPAYYLMDIHGKTPDADIPKPLKAKMEELFDKDKLISIFTKTVTTENGVETVLPTDKIEIFGEGYGFGIQKAGPHYISNGVDFILFDVKVGKYWLTRESCEDIAKKLGVKIVPLVGYMTIPEAEEYVKKGFKSAIAEDGYEAEGLVCEAPCGLLKRSGDRLITKIKTCDYRKLERKLKNMK